LVPSSARRHQSGAAWRQWTGWSCPGCVTNITTKTKTGSDSQQQRHSQHNSGQGGLALCVLTTSQTNTGSEAVRTNLKMQEQRHAHSAHTDRHAQQQHPCAPPIVPGPNEEGQVARATPNTASHPPVLGVPHRWGTPHRQTFTVPDRPKKRVTSPAPHPTLLHTVHPPVLGSR
jgi:hypothetical protein